MSEGTQRLIDQALSGETIDGTDVLYGVETLIFADGTPAYVLGAGSENPAQLAGLEVQHLAGSHPLVVLGDGSETLFLEGAWSNRGEEVIGQNIFVRWVHGSGQATVLILEGVAVEPEEELLTITPIAYWNFNETSGDTVADSAGGEPQDGIFFGCKPDLDDPGPDVAFEVETSADFHHSTNEYIAVAHDEAFEKANGTVQFWFNTDRTWGYQTLFSKDHCGYVNGGHLNIGLKGSRFGSAAAEHEQELLYPDQEADS